MHEYSNLRETVVDKWSGDSFVLAQSPCFRPGRWFFFIIQCLINIRYERDLEEGILSNIYRFLEAGKRKQPLLRRKKRCI